MTKHLLPLVLALFPLTVSAQSVGDGLDLPITPVKFGDKPSNPPVILPDEDDGDDPRDTPPPVLYGEELETETDSIFYVVDRSGSMGWDWAAFLSGNTLAVGSRWDRAKAEVTRSIQGLSENFEFNILVYDCGTVQWAQGMKEATEPNKRSALAWLNGVTLGGATGTGPSVSQALAVRDNRLIVLLTDGSPNCGASGTSGHRVMIRNNNIQAATINVFGIAATGTYRAFCQGVAADSGGSYFDVP